MKEKLRSRRNVWPILPIAALLLGACGSETPSVENDSAQKGGEASKPMQGVDSAASGSTADIAAWLVDRYGPESGIIEYEVRLGPQKSRQTWYFRKHGLQEARYWDLAGEGNSALAHITILDSAQVTVRGPGDPKPTRSAWRPDPKNVLPNFRNLTPEMRRLFSPTELPEREILGKKCSGYQLTVDGMISNVWVWEGIMLYGELQGSGEKGIEPIIMRALTLKTDVPVPEEKFRVK